LKQGPSLNRRVEWAFLQALSRKPTRAERVILEGLHEEGRRQFTAEPQGAREFIQVGEAPLGKTLKPADMAAMTTVARAILNLHETITRN
jgi:hypothetical protein